MSENIADIKNEIRSLEEILKDRSKRDYVEEILESYAEFDRSVIWDKIPTISKYLSKMFGDIKTNVLLDIVSRSVPDIDELLTQFDDSETRDWAERLNRKFVSVYEGVFPPFAHDWYRVRWSTRVDTGFGNVPFLSIRVLKRNGEIVFLDQPFAAALKLMIYQLNQMKAFQERAKAPPGLGVEHELREMNTIVNSILEGLPEQKKT